MEIWQDIINYEGLYQVSNRGRIRSYAITCKTWRGGNYTKPAAVRALALSSRGYIQVTLYNKGRSKNHLVHRLVALAFIENPRALPEINHLDGDKTNNVVSNLEWSSSLDNNLHSLRERFKNLKLTPLDVRFIFNHASIVGGDYSIQDLAIKFQVSPLLIRRVLKKQHYDWLNNNNKEESKCK